MNLDAGADISTINTNANSVAGEYLTFILGSEEYGL